MRLLVVFAFILFTPCLLLCQNGEPQMPGNDVTSLGASVGFTDFHQRDEYLSPDIFRGLMFSSGISFQVKSDQAMHTVEVRFSPGHLNSDVQPRSVAEYAASISYSYLLAIRRWGVAGRPLTFFLGGGLSSFVASTDFTTEDKTTAYVFYDRSWYWSHALDLHFRLGYLPDERRSLSIQATMPLGRLISRPANGHYFNARNAEIINHFLNAATGGQPEYFWKNLVVLCEIEYREPLGERFDLRSLYAFGYYSTDRPLPMRMYMNTLSMGVLWLL